MPLVLTKFEVQNTANDMIQIDCSTLDDSIFVSFVLTKDQAAELIGKIDTAALESEESKYKLPGGEKLKLKDLETIKDLLRANQKINAIKHVRTVYVCGLKEAKDLVDRIQSDEGIVMTY